MSPMLRTEKFVVTLAVRELVNVAVRRGPELVAEPERCLKVLQLTADADRDRVR